jgi:hypothetical protein
MNQPVEPDGRVGTLFTMTVDTEEEWDWNAGWPTTAPQTTNILELPRFQHLCDRHGIAVTYFTDLAVLQDAAAGRVIQEIGLSRRVEIGMHIHPWNTPPIHAGRDVTARESFLHNLPADQILAKLDTVYGQFEKNGMHPRSFRGGRYSSGGLIHRFLRDKGFLVDASVVPYTTWRDEGAPDYRDRDLLPRRLPPRFEGDAPLWEVPLTLGFTRRPFSWWRKCYEFIGSSRLSKLRLIGILERLGVVRRAWLNFEDSLSGGILPLLLLLRKMRLPCICFTIHSSSLTAGQGIYTRTQADQERLFARMEEVFTTLAGWPEFKSATVTEVGRNLEQQHYARTRNKPA